MVFIKNKQKRSSNLSSNQITPSQATLNKKATRERNRIVEPGFDQGSNLPCTFFICRFKLSFLPNPSVEYLHPVLGQKWSSGRRTPGWCTETWRFISRNSAKYSLQVGDRHAMRLLWILRWRLLRFSICQLIFSWVPTSVHGSWQMIDGIWYRHGKSE